MAMAMCEYCGKPAGFFRKKHVDCESRYTFSWKRMIEEVSDSIVRHRDLGSLLSTLRKIAIGGLVPHERIPACLVEGWGQAARKLLEGGPIDEEHEQLLSEFRDRFSLTYEDLDRNHSYSMVVKSAALRN